MVSSDRQSLPSMPRFVRAITALVEAFLLVACAASSAPNSPNGGSSSAATSGGASTIGASTSSAGTGTGPADATMSDGSSSGGSAGAASSSAANGSSDGPSPDAGIGSGTGFFTDGFESDDVGSQPAGFGNLIDYIEDGTNPNSSGDFATVDTTHVHSGAHAVHFHVAAGTNNPSFLAYTLPTGTNTLFMRAWVYLSLQLGDNTASQNDNHETLFALNGSPGNVNNEIRFGAIKGTVGVNATPSDNITPLLASWNGPPDVPATTWACLEVAFLGAPAQNELHAWMNDADLFDVTTPTQWQNGTMPMGWLSGEFVEIDVGWQSFSGFGADVWVDDLGLGNDRIGCD
jgi:hypothetical protein